MKGTIQLVERPASPWSAISGVLVLKDALLKTEVTKISGKRAHQRYLAFYDKQVVLFKDSEYSNAVKVFPLQFTSKYEVIREQPLLKGSVAPVAKDGKKGSTVSTGERHDIVKPEDIQKAGELRSIRLSVEYCESPWEFSAAPETLRKCRSLLSQRINQMGFHHMFKVFKKIGKGNFASVYLAERIDDGQQMAIKAFSKSAVYAEENGKEGLINEICLMRELEHDNIMKLYEVYETHNSLYMGLELLQGGQLYEYLKKKVIFQTKEIQTIMRGLLEGLAQIHKKGIMHRDLKLENILFKNANDIGSVVIADFGLATFVNEPVYLYCRCGTPGFVAPEVINITDMKSTYDSICDVYSLGLVFHILLTGKPGFPGRSYNTIVQQNKEAKINFKAAVFDVVPPQALDLLKKMLEPDPKKRIKAEQALQHEYIPHPHVILSEKRIKSDENIEEEDSFQDDNPDLMTRINKMNDEQLISILISILSAQKFDMLRINQLTNSPIKSPLMQATNKLKQIHQNNDDQEQMIMRTPVITGRVQSVEGIINQQSFTRITQCLKPIPITQCSHKEHQIVTNSSLITYNRRQSIGQQSVLSKYSKNQGQVQVQKTEEESKEGLNIKNVKAQLSKNV